MMTVTRALALALVLVATIAVTLPATGDPGPAPALLTDPYLQNPTRSGVRVAWVTEFEGDRHVVLVGRRAGELDDATLDRVARGRSQGGSGFRVVPARTIELSRTREDQSSQVPGRTYSSIERRDLLIIENVGNLVCPAEFTVGEDVRVMVSSVTEGEEKPLKYPLMFRSCEFILINKIDLLPHLDFDLDLFMKNLDSVHPDVETALVSGRTGEGVDAFKKWLVEAGRTPVRV